MLKFQIRNLCAVVIIFFTGCTQLPGPLPANHAVTFTLQQPLNYECFVNHYVQGVPNTKIGLAIHYTVNHISANNNGPTYVSVAEGTLTFNPSTDVFPLTFTALSPVSGPWNIVVIIEGTQCAECANGYGDQQEASGPCVSYTYTGNPTTYQAAKPRWQGGAGPNNNATVQNIRAPERIPNVLNTCNIDCRIQ